MDKTLSTRKVEKKVSVTILIMQRLAVNDPTGHLLQKKKENVRLICLPGELSGNVAPEEYRSIYNNGLLSPKRMAVPQVQELLKDLGSAGYAGQIGQRPAPEGGTIWGKYLIEVDDKNFPAASDLNEVGTDWDLAYTKDEKNSASAFVSSGILKENMFIFDLGWQWLEFPELIRWMKSKRAPHYIEAKASGKSSKQTLKRNGIIALEVQVTTDKIARAKDATPTAEAGFVYIKKSLADKLYNDPKQGILFFPNGEHNDVADVLSQAITRRFRKGRLVVGEERQAPRDSESEGDEDVFDDISEDEIDLLDEV